MDGTIFLGFVACVVLGVALMALALKALDVQEANAKQEEQRVREAVPSFFHMPAARPVPTAKAAFHDRLPLVHEIDLRMILYALERAGGNHAHAAALVGTDETTFDRIVAIRCPDAGRPLRPAAKPEARPAPARQRDPVVENLFAFVQSQIWAEQAVVSEFVHLPSIDSLYRQARPALTAR